MKEIKVVAVVGAGQMGAGIAQVAAMSGFQVGLFDQNAQALEKAQLGIQKSLEKLESKGKLSLSLEKITQNLKMVESLESLSALQPQLVIEAIIEDFEIKSKLFKQLDQLLEGDCVLASNTSSISITKLAQNVSNPERFIGMHFMNPVPLMKLVEIISGKNSSAESYDLVKTVAEKMNKTTVLSKDVAGFIVNRVLMPMINEACLALQENLASAEDIDQAMVLGTNQPMGPLALADYIGLDTCQYIMEVIYKDIESEKFLPAEILKEKVKAGHLGRKSGQGFYTY